jgi:hypothetical protein
VACYWLSMDIRLFTGIILLNNVCESARLLK